MPSVRRAGPTRVAPAPDAGNARGTMTSTVSSGSSVAATSTRITSLARVDFPDMRVQTMESSDFLDAVYDNGKVHVWPRPPFDTAAVGRNATQRNAPCVDDRAAWHRDQAWK